MFCRAGEEAGPVLKFRNHQPRSEQLLGLQIEKPAIPSVEEQACLPTLLSRVNTIRFLPVHVTVDLDPCKQVDAAEIVHNDATQEPLINLAPKRANWDLKRDLEPQLKKLRTMTDRAIIGLIAKRVAEEQEAETREGPDLALAVEQQGRLNEDED